MNFKTPTFNTWRDCIGLCMICGQPMGCKSKRTKNLERGHDDNKDNNDDFDVDYDKVKEITDDTLVLNLRDESIQKNQSSDDQIEQKLLMEECPIRMVFLRFNMLGEQQDCHIIDQYTFLEKKNKEESFIALLKNYKDIIEKVDGKGYFSVLISCLLSDENSLAEKTIAMCKRVGDNLLFAGCRRCNMCMNKPNFHVDTVYRCFRLTQNIDNTLLESRSAKAIKIKKIIQQIAFYFDYDVIQVEESAKNNKRTNKKNTETDTIKWNCKDETKLILDVDIWRCISSLCYWGNTLKYRFRLIAIFHASHYLYITSSMRAFLPFEDWHIHFFRELYMDTVDSSTFFGLEEREVRLIFNLSKKDGQQWQEMIVSRIKIFEVNLEKFYKTKKLNNLYVIKEKIDNSVWDEKSLLSFLCKNDTMENGVERFLDFFQYHISSVKDRDLESPCTNFKKQLCKALRDNPSKKDKPN